MCLQSNAILKFNTVIARMFTMKKCTSSKLINGCWTYSGLKSAILSLSVLRGYLLITVPFEIWGLVVPMQSALM